MRWRIGRLRRSAGSRPHGTRRTGQQDETWTGGTSCRTGNRSGIMSRRTATTYRPADRVWGMPERCTTNTAPAPSTPRMLRPRASGSPRTVAGHAHRGHGRGGRGRPGDRHPGRIRRAAGAEPGGRLAEPSPLEDGRQRPRLRPQPAGLGGAAGGLRAEGLARRDRHAGPGALLRLSGGRGRRGQDLHGARRRVRRRRCGDLLAPGADDQGHRPRRLSANTPHRLHLPRAARPMPPPRRTWAARRWTRSN